LVQEFTLAISATTTSFTNLLEDQKASNEYGEFEGEEFILANMALQSKYAKEYLIS